MRIPSTQIIVDCIRWERMEKDVRLRGVFIE